MKQLKFANQSLMLLVTDTALLKSPSAAGASVTLTLDDNKNFADNDYVIIGEPGKAKSELAQINNTVTLGTAIRVDTLTYPHPVGTPVYKVPYNQVKFYRAATLAGAKSLLSGGTVAIDAQNEYTTFVDVTNTSGYLFFTLYNAETTTESGYSAGFNYGTIPYGSRIKIREFVTSPHNWNKPLDDNTFNTLCDFAESEIFAIKNWRFREKISEFSSVVDQQGYTKEEAGVTDLGQLLYATYDGNPVFPVSLRVHKRLNWNNSQTGIPRTVCEFDDTLLFTPIPSEVKTIELYHYRNSVGFADETVETEVKLPQTIGFRVLQDLWATADMKKSQYFERRFLQAVAAMKLDDVKQVSKFPALSDVGMDNRNTFDQVEHPNTIG